MGALMVLRSILSLGLLALPLVVHSADTVQVTVYEGPKECEDVDKVVAGKYLSMHYTGTIDASSAAGEPGKQFDSSRNREGTFDFPIGQGQVIKGWDEGLLGLCKGAKATLVIPPEMGYGDSGAGADIPGGATLHFDIEVVSIADEAPPETNLFLVLDTNKDKKLSQEEILVFFKKQGQEMPEGLFGNGDKDGDGFVSWEEFGGPKGEAEPSYEEEL